MIIDTSILGQTISSHPYLAVVVSAGLGGVVAHPDKCADAVFSLVLKTPLKRVVLLYWPKFSKWFDMFQVEFDKRATQEQVSPVQEPPKL